MTMTTHAMRQCLAVAGLLLTMALAAYQAARLDAARAPGHDVHRIKGGAFEPSGVVHVPGTDGVLFVSDGRTREVFWMRLGADGLQHEPARAVPLDADVTDLEGITTDGTHFYVVGSQSKKKGTGGDGLVRFTFDPGAVRIGRVEKISGMKAWLAQHVAELAGTAHRLGDAVLNIEAVAWDAVNERLLLGLRAPVIDGRALVIPVTLADPSRGFVRDNLRLDGGRALRLPLEGAGIRSLEFDPLTGAYKLITGADRNRERLDFRVLEWRGGETPADIRPVSVYPRRLKPEGIARAALGGRQVSVLVFDVGRFAVTD